MMTPQAERTTSRAGRVWRAALTTLGAVVVVGALGGCSSTSTSGSARSSDPASQQQQGGSGVTVFGDIDVNVTRERTR
jgi:type II secretory pathway component PulL